MAIATINITGVIGGKELGFPEPTFNVANLIHAIKLLGDVDGYNFIIDSDGGSVDEGFRIAGLIESLPNTTTTAKKVASIANVIYFAGQKRTALKGAQWMLHTASGGVFGTAEDHRAYADSLEATNVQIADYITSKTGLSTAEIVPLMAVDRYIDEEQAKAFGFLADKKVNKTIALNISNMDIKKYVNAAFSAYKKAVGGAVNMAITLEDGTAIWVETEDGELAGKKAYKEESGAPLADGEYKLKDGREATVVGGVIEGISEDAGEMPTDADATGDKALAEAMAKITALEAEIMQLKTAQTEMDAMHNRATEAETQVQKQALQIQNLARLVSKPQKFEGAQNLAGVNGKRVLSDEEQLKAIEERRKRM